MSHEPGTDHFKAAILEILNETFASHHGHYLDKGTSLFETLATVSAAEASIPVSVSCASIATQVNHVIYYLDVLAHDLVGNEPTDVNWNAAWNISPVNDDEWSALIARLRATADETTALLAGTTEWNEDLAYDAVSIAVHTAYHQGEIRQALCTIQNRPPNPANRGAAPTRRSVFRLVQKTTIDVLQPNVSPVEQRIYRLNRRPERWCPAAALCSEPAPGRRPASGCREAGG